MTASSDTARRGAGSTSPRPGRAALGAGAAGGKPRSLRTRTDLVALAFLLPGLLCFGYFAWLPLIRGMELSFQQTNLVDPASWVGLKNFPTVRHDPLVMTAVKNTLGMEAGADVHPALALRRPLGTASSTDRAHRRCDARRRDLVARCRRRSLRDRRRPHPRQRGRGPRPHRHPPRIDGRRRGVEHRGQSDHRSGADPHRTARRRTVRSATRHRVVGRTFGAVLRRVDGLGVPALHRFRRVQRLSGRREHRGLPLQRARWRGRAPPSRAVRVAGEPVGNAGAFRSCGGRWSRSMT